MIIIIINWDILAKDIRMENHFKIIKLRKNKIRRNSKILFLKSQIYNNHFLSILTLILRKMWYNLILNVIVDGNFLMNKILKLIWKTVTPQTPTPLKQNLYNKNVFNVVKLWNQNKRLMITWLTVKVNIRFNQNKMVISIK